MLILLYSVCAFTPKIQARLRSDWTALISLFFGALRKRGGMIPRNILLPLAHAGKTWAAGLTGLCVCLSFFSFAQPFSPDECSSMLYLYFINTRIRWYISGIYDRMVYSERISRAILKNAAWNRCVSRYISREILCSFNKVSIQSFHFI